MHVYILKHAFEPRFKIGKANDPSERSNQISKSNDLDFGRISAFDFGDESLAFQIEKNLHALFSPWRLAPDESWGDGRTEWFDISALPAAHSTLTLLEGLTQRSEQPAREGFERRESARTSSGARNFQESPSFRFKNYLAAQDSAVRDGGLWQWNGACWRRLPEGEESKIALDWLEKYSRADYSLKKARQLIGEAKATLPEAPSPLGEPILPFRNVWLGRDMKARLPDRNQGVFYANEASLPVDPGQVYAPSPLPEGSLLWRYLETAFPQQPSRRRIQESCADLLVAPNEASARLARIWSGKGEVGKAVLISLLSFLCGNVYSREIFDENGIDPSIHDARAVFLGEMPQGKPREALKRIIQGLPVPTRDGALKRPVSATIFISSNIGHRQFGDGSKRCKYLNAPIFENCFQEIYWHHVGISQEWADEIWANERKIFIDWLLAGYVSGDRYRHFKNP